MLRKVRFFIYKILISHGDWEWSQGKGYWRTREHKVSTARFQVLCFRCSLHGFSEPISIGIHVAPQCAQHFGSLPHVHFVICRRYCIVWSLAKMGGPWKGGRGRCAMSPRLLSAFSCGCSLRMLKKFIGRPRSCPFWNLIHFQRGKFYEYLSQLIDLYIVFCTEVNILLWNTYHIWMATRVFHSERISNLFAPHCCNHQFLISIFEGLKLIYIIYYNTSCTSIKVLY